jgi:hypothetical protein
MQKPIYSAEDEQEIMARLWSPGIADNPYNFVMFNYPWGKPNTPLANFKGPRKWQRRVLMEITEHIEKNRNVLDMDVLRKAIVSGRGIGKSALVTWLINWMLSTRIGSSVIVSANSEAQLKSITWAELIKWTAMGLNAHWWETSATKLVPAQWLTDIVERDLKKGTRYWAAEGKLWSEENPDSYAGPHNYDGMMVIFDEASGIPDAIWSVALGFFTENIPNRFFFAFSNGRRNNGYFFECFNGKRDFWSTDSIDARTVEDTDKKFYEAIIAEYGADSREARVEVYGEFPAEGEDQFISPTMVEDAFNRAAYEDDTAPIVIGVDPARGGLDSTVIVVRRGRDLARIYRYKGDDTMTVVGHVINIMDEWNPDLVCIDEGGLGSGVVDRLKEQNYRKCRGVNFGWSAKDPVMWGNKRAEMWGDMKNWLKTASIPRDPRLKIDLISPRKKPDSVGTIYLETKKEMKARGVASPDSADALCVTFAFPVGNRRSTVDKNGRIRDYHFTHPISSSWMSN